MLDGSPSAAANGGIVWLASYPKSGNTWFRAFLSCLLNDEARLHDLDFRGIPISSNRAIFDERIAVEASDLTQEQIGLLRPAVYEALAKEARRRPIFLKAHDAWTHNAAGEPVLSRRATQGAIYLIRDPRDVAVSFAHHRGKSIDNTIDMMAREGQALCSARNDLPTQLRQETGSWSGHVLSWTEQADVPVHVVRYEDLKDRPIETFTAAVRFAGWPASDAEIAAAIEASRFERLKAREEEHGFRERPREARTFFRRGQVGGWREELSPEQQARIVETHRQVMARFGYHETGYEQSFSLPPCRGGCSKLPAAAQVAVPRQPWTQSAGTQHIYLVYGLRIQSNIPLPLPLATGTMAADATIQWEDDLECPPGLGQLSPVLWGDRRRLYFELPGAASILVQNGQEIRVRLAAATAAEQLTCLLLRPVLAALLTQRGLAVLHASVVRLQGRTVAFLGHSATGKSTLAAWLHEQGQEVLADDLCPVFLAADGRPHVLPGGQTLEVWQDVLDRLGRAPDSLCQAHPESRRYRLPISHAPIRDPVPLDACYALVMTNEPHGKFERDQGHRAVVKLHGFLVWPCFAEACGNTAELFRIIARTAARVPLSTWSFVPELERLPEVRAALEENLAAALGG